MQIKTINLHKQYLSIKDEIDDAISNSIKNSAFVGGNQVSNFEIAFSSYQQSKYCISCGNGTDALEIAIESLNMPPNSEIIVPGNSFIASAEAVTRTGHKVIFCDINSTDYNLSIEKLDNLITKRTKAIIAVHLYGHPAKMDEILKICLERNLFLIEDCSQAHGSEYKGKRVGSIGDIGTFSFYPGKNLGAYGDGGAIITNSSLLAEKAKLISNHGRFKKYDHIIEGRNSRLDGLQAAILSVKLNHLDEWIKRRRELAIKYRELIKTNPNISKPIEHENCFHTYHQFILNVNNRDELIEYLKENGIQTGIHYPISLPMLKAYSYLNQTANTPLANKLSKRIISLPIGETLENEEIEYVSEKINNFYEIKC